MWSWGHSWLEPQSSPWLTAAEGRGLDMTWLKERMEQLLETFGCRTQWKQPISGKRDSQSFKACFWYNIWQLAAVSGYFLVLQALIPQMQCVSIKWFLINETIQSEPRLNVCCSHIKRVFQPTFCALTLSKKDNVNHVKPSLRIRWSCFCFLN